MNIINPKKGYGPHLVYRLPLFLLLLGIVFSPSSASAANCGTHTHPSFSASCQCPMLTKVGTIRASNRKHCISHAVKKAKQLCLQHPKAKLAWKVLSKRNAKTCMISYQCRMPQTKHKGLRWSRKLYFRKGSYKYRFKHRIHQNPKHCKKAAKRLKKKKCQRTPQILPTQFKWKKIRKNIRYFMGYKKGYCHIVWKCTFKKKQAAYWCGH